MTVIEWLFYFNKILNISRKLRRKLFTHTPQTILVSETGSLLMHEENTVAVFSKMFQECAVNKITKSFLRIHSQNSHVSPCSCKGVPWRTLPVLKAEGWRTHLQVSVEQMSGDRTAVGTSSPTPWFCPPPPCAAVQEIPGRPGAFPDQLHKGVALITRSYQPMRSFLHCFRSWFLSSWGH